MKDVYLGLGTNKGDREANLKQAIELINNFNNSELKEISAVYETEPWGYTQQDDFLNLCVRVQTKLGPHELLTKCQQVEKELKRERKIKWGPRTIDVDILVYDDLKLNDEELILPHPRMQERAFVLVPLSDLNNNLIIKGKSIKEWLSIIKVVGLKEYNSKIIESIKDK
ncbi:2-amino-4-hydroxy-6-hydroxymethyldihydropteridine pyrophosphokinase [Halobacteroides halobius DSM 5150]|uniref:2-amino-4-hydroxy-6-hydroxymethyldihydropteridine diphosphokinase n=1 Tax=Halobacteroides halobius (strain ATCC 35273 / DSM 5150 / MD-1) TaxID=748449 RepID=L0K7Z3_HALHC|nr:2-amino-4-hydroxy-6-hydroxymethyldihydropteridine diphosphokinase [Halobacteroides halobius]AGB40474.1 2-amino-4-hydroxy-6-hydroxymethyldihydropteridine pyrophosphokinase [Halobacteroides halobius DSM 5150]